MSRLRIGLLAAVVTMAVAAGSLRSQDADIIRELDQNWDARTQSDWESAPQGSRLIPLDWLRALEQPEGGGLFLAPDHMARFRYVPKVPASANGLPVGFAVDDTDHTVLERTRLEWLPNQPKQTPWVGLTCAACHTAEISFKGSSGPVRTMRIFGGPSLSDFQSFIRDLNDALQKTVSDSARWNRFAKTVLGTDDNEPNRARLKDAFAKLLAWQEKEAAINRTDVRYGYGRVDAFGRIYNKVSLLAGDSKAGATPPDAPVSFPFLWRVPQLDRVQYNGIAPKKTLVGMPFDFGALARNAGEVVGVFGDVVPKRDAGIAGYESSIDVGNLAALETMLMSLRPPKWPQSVFGPIDAAAADRGRGLYSQHCAACHQLVDRTNLADLIKTEMSLFDGSSRFNASPNRTVPPPGTDPWMACNAYDYRAASGILAGQSIFVVAGDPLPPEAPISNLLTTTVVGSLLGQKLEMTEAATAALFRIERRPEIGVRSILLPNPRRSSAKAAQLDRCFSQTSNVLGYISRPLNGIWATAPYLHNGSVPTLFDLLLPPDQRPKRFNVGTREYDPVSVGYRTGSDAPGNTFVFETHDANGNVIDGNSNAGHDYGNVLLSDAERRALIEYLKTL